jgi:tRNA(Arg) A34 adenosine deaminase TadA
MTGHQEIYDEVRDYLQRTASHYRLGEDPYYARLALEQAMWAGQAGNFAIGAVAVVREGAMVREYRAGNAIFTGAGVVDHAEVRAMLKWREGKPPDDSYRADEERVGRLREGVHVFGTVEPCPMCACALTHVGATRSISTVLDGALVRDGDYLISGGAAAAIGDKQRLQPARWREIQVAQRLVFELLSTADEDLRRLSHEVWKASERELVAKLERGGVAEVAQQWSGP